jgi:acetolactate synthase I/II/III large subunit
MPTHRTGRTAAELIVACLENEGVTHVFGIPGEENIRLVDAISRSGIEYVLARHEQGASFMAETYGRLTGRAGVCSATLGPGAINLLLGTADATTNSTPLVALSAQVGTHRSFKESHQGVDLVPMFTPVTKWSALVPSSSAVPEMIRKAFKLAQTERPGAVYLAVPEDVEEAAADGGLAPLNVNVPRPDEPSPGQVARAAEILRAARSPIVLAGHGAARAGAGAALRRFATALGVPVATTFHGKGVFPDDHPLALGAVGFMQHDYVNFGFDQADAIVAVGYELQEFDPMRINPRGEAKIIHIHRFPAEVDAHYDVAVGLHSGMSRTLDALAAAVTRPHETAGTGTAGTGTAGTGTAGTQAPEPAAPPSPPAGPRPHRHRIRALLAGELDRGRADDRFPLAPARVVADTRAALRREDIVLVDTGAPKMWMARLYPTYEPNTCLISNGLSTMAWTVPGAIGARIARPGARVLVSTGDGAFLMNSQEIETAMRLGLAFVILIWVDDAYGLISWKMDMEIGRDVETGFGNPDFVGYAESFGAAGYRIGSAAELLPTLRTALAADTVSVIACPVDYSANLDLITSLGDLDESMS